MPSKWPRIRWNQANAKLANRPFQDLFAEKDKTMDTIESLQARVSELLSEHHKASLVIQGWEANCEKLQAEIERLQAWQREAVKLCEMLQYDACAEEARALLAQAETRYPEAGENLRRGKSGQ